MRLTSDKVVVITGSNRGLGLEFVTQIIDNTEAAVVATSRNPAKFDQLQALAKEAPSRLQLVSLDAGDESSVEAAAQEVAKAHAGVDLLINNAGIDEGIGPILETSASTYSNIMNVNVVGTFLVTKAFLPLLRKKPSRVVVNMSSGQGSISHNRLAFTHPERNPLGAQWIAYNASKAAVNMQTSVLANELKKDDFCIIAMCPGWVDTDMGGGNARKMGKERAPLTPQDSIAKMLQVIQRLSPEHSGKYLDRHFNKVDY